MSNSGFISSIHEPDIVILLHTIDWDLWFEWKRIRSSSITPIGRHLWYGEIQHIVLFYFVCLNSSYWYNMTKKPNIQFLYARELYWHNVFNQNFLSIAIFPSVKDFYRLNNNFLLLPVVTWSCKSLVGHQEAMVGQDENDQTAEGCWHSGQNELMCVFVEELALFDCRPNICLDLLGLNNQWVRGAPIINWYEFHWEGLILRWYPQQHVYSGYIDTVWKCYAFKPVGL